MVYFLDFNYTKFGVTQNQYINYSMTNEQKLTLENLKKDVEVLKRAYGFLLATYIVFFGLLCSIIVYLIIW